MGSHQDRLILHDAFDSLVLESIQSELIVLRQFLGPDELLSAVPTRWRDEFVDAVGFVYALVCVVFFVVAHF